VRACSGHRDRDRDRDIVGMRNAKMIDYKYDMQSGHINDNEGWGRTRTTTRMMVRGQQ
jgi:hypothetical protein